MKYLGGLRGVGDLVSGKTQVARAEYELDGYLSNTGEVTGSGELHLAADVLKEIFGRPDLHLRTAGGRLLPLRFSGKRLSPGDDRVHVDIAGNLPDAAAWRRGVADPSTV